MLNEVQVRSLSSADMAKYQGLLGVFIGIVIAILYSGMFFIMVLVNQTSPTYRHMGSTNYLVNDTPGLGVALAVSVCMIILLPLFYGVVGYIGGYILTGVGNKVLGYIGGIRMTIFEKVVQE